LTASGASRDAGRSQNRGATPAPRAPDEIGVQVIDIVKSFRFESGPRA
jgi:hypothetical protein